MEQILIANSALYPHLWTSVCLLIFLVLFFNLYRMKKNHPEIFEPDTTADSEQCLLEKEEIRRQYGNNVRGMFLIFLCWLVGLDFLVLSDAQLKNNEYFVFYIGFFALLFAGFITSQSKK